MDRRNALRGLLAAPFAALASAKIGEHLAVRPGDCVVLTAPKRSTAQEMEECRRMWEEHMPSTKCVVVSDDVGIAVVRSG